jgi:hypothetical protein
MREGVVKRLAAWVLCGVAASADHGAPTTRPTAIREPDGAAPGESQVVELTQEGYKVGLSWVPAQPKPGELVTFRARVTSPSGDLSTIVVNASITRTEPGDPSVLLPGVAVPSEAVPPDGRYVFSQVLYTGGTYRIEVAVDDLSQGKKFKVGHDLSLGQVASPMPMYGVAAGGTVLILIVLAVGLLRRKPG